MRREERGTTLTLRHGHRTPGSPIGSPPDKLAEPIVVGSFTSDDDYTSMTTSSRPPALRRSMTPTATSTSIPDSAQRSQLPLPSRLYKSRSANNIQSNNDPMTAAVAPAAALFALRDDQVMDTRTPSPLHRVPSATSSAEDYKPDLSAEVAMLSTKLVNAINYQTNLDDSLQQARHELEQARQELARVQEQKRQIDELVQTGVLVRASDFERRLHEMRSQIALERAARDTAERAKKQTEAELENLTVSLFEEANKMVAAARKETESSEKKNSQLRKELDDTELLLASQQEQLQDLKVTLEKLEQSSEPGNGEGRDASMPSTPVRPSLTAFDSLHSPSGADGSMDIPPEHPLHFSHLLQPIMRNDISAYAEFVELMSLARLYRAQPHSRNGSNHTTASTSSQTHLPATNISSPNLPGAFSFSTSSSPQSSAPQMMGPALKESKFYKRSLVEDLEPTLRLDLAPGLSFISRRTVMSALLQGNLVVEPFLQQARFYGPLYPCALCGEARKNEPYVRKHRFRTSEEDNAQRYPLCDYCLNRIRAAGDFVGFLRIVRDGHWKCDSEEEQKNAWEESTKLRERMFWARLGGGVVPAVALHKRDVRSSTSTATRPSFESMHSPNPGAVAATTPGRSASIPVIVSGVAAAKQSQPAEKHVGDEQKASDHTTSSSPPSETSRRLSAAIARVWPRSTLESTLNEQHSMTDNEVVSHSNNDTTSMAMETGIPQDSTTNSDVASIDFKDAEEKADSDAASRLSTDPQNGSVTTVPDAAPPSTESETDSTGLNTVSAPTTPALNASRETSTASPGLSGPSSGVLARVRAMEAKAQAQVRTQSQSSTERR